MTYSLNQFCGDLRSILKKDGVDGLAEISKKLQALLVEPTFVAATFTEETPAGQRVLFHDAETDAYVLAHVQHPKKSGAPHSHGASWAIYGNARGYTDMTEWKRVNSDSEDHAELAVKKKYSIGPGQTHAYGPGEIHSTAHPEKAWVIRVTGTDLDKIPRFHSGQRPTESSKNPCHSGFRATRDFRPMPAVGRVTPRGAMQNA